MHIGTAGLAHETHTFLPSTTGIEPFEDAAVRGSAIHDHFRGTNTVMGGFISEAEDADVSLSPIVHSRGGISGTVEDEVYETYVTEMTEGFDEIADDLDGLTLFLHGAMVTESRQDPERDIVRELRSVVGDDLPIAVAMDLHGNIDESMLEYVDVICGYRSSPHVDYAHTGRRAMDLLVRTIDGEIEPTMAVSKPGIAVPSPFSATTTSPATDIVARNLAWKHQPELNDVTNWDRVDDVLDTSFFFGFAWSDVQQVGATALAVTDDDTELAQRIVNDVADFAWERREGLSNPDELADVESGVSHALEIAKTASDPVLVLDAADRLAETTFVLRELLEQDASNVAVPLLYDPDAVEQCFDAGTGAVVDLSVGSGTSDRGGGAVALEGTVEWIGHEPYTATGPMSVGNEVDHGPTAIVDVDGVWLQLTSKRDTFGLIDTDPIEQYGYDATSFDVIVSKSKTHFRAVYEELAEEIVIVDAPEYSPADLSVFEYENVDGVFPIDQE